LCPLGRIVLSQRHFDALPTFSHRCRDVPCRNVSPCLAGLPMRTFLTIMTLLVTAPAFAQGTLRQFTVSKDIKVIQITLSSFVHVSYAQVPGWGRIASNGLICTSNGEALLFDTPMTDSLTADLVRWVRDSLGVRIVGFVPNHWHDDCMGGLKYLQSIGIPSFANERTIAIAKSKHLPVPVHSFSDSLTLSAGALTAVCKYYGAAHTVDNIVTWIPSENILFGGCMVKDMTSATLGNVADADLDAWPHTIARVIAAYPADALVIPGHGPGGGMELLQHTLDLLSQRK
jgi:metallo-beta-lactamase class B